MTRDALYIAARAPRPGFTKSRLGRTIGHQQAAYLYAAFLSDLAGRFRSSPFPPGWYVTPEDAADDLAPFIRLSRPGTGRSGRVIVQGAGDWTGRQHALFEDARARREQRTVLIASDSPQIEVETVAEAFARLASADVVFGPTEDGGYYLIGVRQPTEPGTPAPWDVLTTVRMSTGTVLDEILARADRLGLCYALLPTTFDVDEATDLTRLIPLALARDDLAATRAALESLGLLTAWTAAADVPDSGLVGVGGPG